MHLGQLLIPLAAWHAQEFTIPRDSARAAAGLAILGRGTGEQMLLLPRTCHHAQLGCVSAATMFLTLWACLIWVVSCPT